MPVTLLAFGLGGVSLMGLPPSGGFLAKWWLLLASVQSGQWAWCLVILAGGLLAGGYVFRVVAPAISGEPLALARPVARSRELVTLLLALGAIALGVAPDWLIDLVRIGRGTP
jgi:formate hydrogenlyase subunit 3/multisubunit Na+/H+ antiporter MnhD subunit